MNISEVRARLQKVHQDKVSIFEDTYVNFKSHAKFMDITYGPWEALVYYVCRGGVHPLRSEEIRCAKELKKAKAKIRDKFGDRVTLTSEKWAGSDYRYTFIDTDFGEWEGTVGNILQKQCHGHPSRSMLARGLATKWTEEEIQNILPPELTLVPGTYKGMLIKATFIDSEYGVYEAFPGNVVHKKTSHRKRANLKFSVTTM